MTDQPTLIVEIGFTGPGTGTALHLDDPVRGLLDTATLAGADLWTDVTEWVSSVSLRRGATRADGPVLRYEAGTATIALRNEDRRFDPTNLAGPYVAGGVTQVEPMRAVRIRAAWGGQTWPLFRGYADEWRIGYAGPDWSEVTLTCSDAFKVFASYDRGESVPVGAGEDSGARIGRILDSISWPDTDRDVDTGDSTVQATTLAANVLTELLLTADSEMGQLYMDPEGRVRFRRRQALLSELVSTRPNAVFGDDPDTAGTATTINLATNPSVELDTAGWRATGSVAPTLARSSAQAWVGTYSLEATWGTGGVLPGVAYDIEGLTVGRMYTISMYVYVPTGSPDVALISTSVWGSPANTGGVRDAWVRMSWTGTAVATTRAIGIWPVGSPTAGQMVYLDGLQVEEGTSPTAYVDGDQTSAEWDGTEHASTSRRLPELPYADVAITYDDQSIYNRITVARAGGTEQMAEDTASQTAYLTRTWGRSDLSLATDVEVQDYAEFLLVQTRDPELRFAQLDLSPLRDPDRLFPQALGRQFGDRITVIRRPPGGGDPIERQCFVAGVEHQVKPGVEWSTRLVLQSATRYAFFVLDNPMLGVLGSNSLGY